MQEESIKTRIAGFLSEKLGTKVSIEGFRRFPVGFSWATFGIDVSSSDRAVEPKSLILRVGPDDGLFAPYSAERQFQVLSALERSPVPSPRVYWHSDDRSILGLPFFICERASGRAPLPSAGVAGDPVELHRATIGEQFVRSLAHLHAFDWASARELSAWDPGTTVDNTALRQTESCFADYNRWTLRPEPAVIWAIHWLRRNAPKADRLGIVHGDYRIGNFLVDGDRITAILDWESAHIGDPHEDLGFAVLPLFTAGTGLVCRLLPEDEFLNVYERYSGRQVDRRKVRYYAIMSLLKMALVSVAATQRFELSGTSDIRMAALGTQAVPIFRQMQKMIEAAG